MINHNFIDICNLKINEKRKFLFFIKPTNFEGLSNNIKNVLSVFRYKNKTNCNILICDKNMLNEIFDFTKFKIFPENNSKVELFYRSSWRFAIFDNDNNLDKVINNHFSIMFPDFNEYNIFTKYNNNCIDFFI